MKLNNKPAGTRGKEKGFTLVEVLVYIAVLSLIIVAISSFVIWLVHSNTKTKAMRETLDSARRALETMTHEIREAENIYLPTTTANQLSLETKKYLPTDEETTYIDFYLCQTQLCQKRESQVPVALTSDKVEVSSLTFTRIVSGQAPAIQINLKVDYKNPANRPEYRASVSLISTAALRTY